MSRRYQHVPRRLPDGRWVCKGGERPPHGKPCPFEAHEYHEAVTHATKHGGTPPDPPREVYA
jgi:hypothetical protein